MKNLKYHIFVVKHYFSLVFSDDKMLKEEKSTEILKILGFIGNIKLFCENAGKIITLKIRNHFIKKNGPFT